MGALALVLGILSLIVFDWLGVAIGSAIATASMVQAAMTGKFEIPTDPIWQYGIGISVVLPLASMVVGIIAMKNPEKRGLGIAGMVCSIVAALIGLAFTLFLAFTASVPKHLSQAEMNDMANQLNQAINDPELEKTLKQGLEDLQKQQQPQQQPQQQ
jgi:FtsH-binding integral membrane protein